jgi:ATP/ADP translocase
VTTVPEAKKYYPLFGLGANVALIFSGQYVRFVSAVRKGKLQHRLRNHQGSKSYINFSRPGHASAPWMKRALD